MAKQKLAVQSLVAVVILHDASKERNKYVDWVLVQCYNLIQFQGEGERKLLN